MRTAASVGIDRGGYVADSLVGRLTNAFSKKVENHAHSDAIHTMHYNFVRIYQMQRRAPTMAPSVTGDASGACGHDAGVGGLRCSQGRLTA